MFDQFVHDRPRHQCLQPTAHQNIRLQASCFSFIDETQGMIRPSLHHIADIGAESDDLFIAAAGNMHLNGHERRIDHADPHPFHGGDEIGLAVLVLSQHRGEKPHQRRTTDRRAHIVPGTVLADFHVDVTAEGRIPPLYGRQALACTGGAGNQRFQALRICGVRNTVGKLSGVFGHRHEIVTVGALVSLCSWFKFWNGPRGADSRHYAVVPRDRCSSQKDG